MRETSEYFAIKISEMARHIAWCCPNVKLHQYCSKHHLWMKAHSKLIFFPIFETIQIKIIFHFLRIISPINLPIDIFSYTIHKKVLLKSEHTHPQINIFLTFWCFHIILIYFPYNLFVSWDLHCSYDSVFK